jgi:hypothetical protein
MKKGESTDGACELWAPSAVTSTLTMREGKNLLFPEKGDVDRGLHLSRVSYAKDALAPHISSWTWSAKDQAKISIEKVANAGSRPMRWQNPSVDA